MGVALTAGARPVPATEVLPGTSQVQPGTQLVTVSEPLALPDSPPCFVNDVGTSLS